ncbi:alpha-ketoacid dehydrogenase subunit alpha/beta [Paludibaculum fermentans]|uniref:Dehydrogenase E1 component subunit alpha/beta n=1 Tax=Paludibaculum fermentans TaxID=1473598 RepID=A0A7S7NWU2_PALFE|nr:dehydrogenase E1 component subunit alpha/beta [Paludibaculum fermentans]QOY91227.1 dehydrogenase E1 component subunit alpha/beta [Paludibaculum fermentans]
MAARADSLPVIVPHDVTLELYRRMLTVSLVEARLKVFAKQGKCTFQASTRGHEKLQIGMTMLLRPGHDWFFPYYRSKALAIGLGVPLKDIFLAMLSRSGDPSSNGRNMPEHFSDPALHLVAQTAVTGSQYLPAVGLARSLQLDGSDQVVHVSSGEGATSEGEFFEALNWASRESLPVVFTVQNNGFAISTRQQVQTGSTVRQIARGFGVRTFHIDGTWYEDMYRDLPPAIQQVRDGAGPILIEADVVRLDPHSSSDDHRKYRGEVELAAVQERDPIQRTELYLLRHGVITREEIDRQREAVRAEVDKAALEADAAPQPTGDDLMAHIYSPVPTPIAAPPQPISAEPVTMIDAINHALREEMAANPRVVMFGEDIADPKGGVFGVTRGLAGAFPGRVENAPLAEASIIGVASGMAMRGFVPVVEIQFADYIWPAMMQLRNEVPTVRWRSQGQWSNPMVVRVAAGGYIKGGPWHSACIEATFAHIPGWRVVFPSSADDAKGLLKTAMRCGDPVLFLEHKGLYRKMQAKALEPDANYAIPFGQGRIRRKGSDLTIVTWGSTVYQALELARQMESEGVSLEVVDLRTIAPFDEEMVYRSVRKTSRVVVAHEDSLTGGFGGEIVARIAQNVLDSLDAPVVRVAAKDTFVPSAANLELMALPSVQDLRDAVEKVLRY